MIHLAAIAASDSSSCQLPVGAEFEMPFGRRMLIARQRTQWMLSLQSLLARHGLNVASAAELKKWGREQLQELGMNPFSQLQAEVLLKLLGKQFNPEYGSIFAGLAKRTSTACSRNPSTNQYQL